MEPVPIPLSLRPPLLQDEIVLLTLYSFVFIVGTVGNGFVIHSFASNTAAGSRFVVALAIVDLITSIWVPCERFLQMAYRFHNFEGRQSLVSNLEEDYQDITHSPLSDSSCRFIHYCYPALFYASSWLLFAISCERLR